MSTFAGPLHLLDDLHDDIWADNFSIEGSFAPSCFLLSHAHTDHLVGLASLSHCKIYAHPDTINYLRLWRDAYNRRLHEADLHSKGSAHKHYAQACRRNNFVEVQYNVAYWLDTRSKAQAPVRMVPLDAGHCPGSCMFLLERFTPDQETVTKAILFGGDQRCDPDYISSLRDNKWLQPYIKKSGGSSDRDLDVLVLDTSAILSDNEVLSKREAIESVIETIRLFPPATKFFLNAWTTGYEELLLAVAREFDAKIHVDKFKASYLQKAPLQAHITESPRSTRFHACEKTWKCDEVWANGRGCCADFAAALTRQVGTKHKRYVGCGCQWDSPLHQDNHCTFIDSQEGHVVFVNPIEPFERLRYFRHKTEVEERIKEATNGQSVARLPTYLLAPLGRHSALPELRRFVALFRPLTVIPNTIYDRHSCLDYFLLPKLLGDDVLGQNAAQRMRQEAERELCARTAKARKSSLQALLAVRNILTDEVTVEITSHLRGMFDHLDGPVELGHAVEVALGIASSELGPTTMQGLLKRAFIADRDHAPAALQADVMPPWLRTREAARTSTPTNLRAPTQPPSPSWSTLAPSGSQMGQSCKYETGDASTRKRRHDDITSPALDLPARSARVSIREFTQIDKPHLSARERKRWISNIARTFRRGWKASERDRISNLAKDIRQSAEMRSHWESQTPTS